MIWLSWRQFRAQALAGAVALAIVAGYLVVTGLDIRDAYDAALARCAPTGDCADALARFQEEFSSRLLLLAGLFALIPALLGMFWGAPLVARELETGTHRLVWSQSVTRRRWLTVKLLVAGLVSMAVAGVASALLTWAASPFDRVSGERFSTVMFGARGIAPVAYAALAFVLGAVLGTLLRRTVPAMALTFVLFVAWQFVMPNLVRPHLIPPEHEVRPMTAAAINEARSIGSLGNAPVVNGLSRPGAWISGTSELRTADGRSLDPAKFNDCLQRAPKTGATGTYGDIAPCLAALDLHVDLDYQPNDRYWAFQWLESAIYLALSALLTAFGLWRVRRAT